MIQDLTKCLPEETLNLRWLFCMSTWISPKSMTTFHSHLQYVQTSPHQHVLLFSCQGSYIQRWKWGPTWRSKARMVGRTKAHCSIIERFEQRLNWFLSKSVVSLNFHTLQKLWKLTSVIERISVRPLRRCSVEQWLVQGTGILWWRKRRNSDRSTHQESWSNLFCTNSFQALWIG